MIVKGKNIQLRPVEVEDAAFIVKLRNHPERSRYLHPVSQNVDAQIAWIKSYKKRESTGEEFYFIIENNKTGALYGTIRLHDMIGDTFTWGSWIILPESPKKTAIETLVTLYEYAFGLKLEKSHFYVKKDNLHAISFYDRFGAIRTHEDNENLYYAINWEHYKPLRKKYAQFMKDNI